MSAIPKEGANLCVNCIHSLKLSAGPHDLLLCSGFVDPVEGNPVLCSEARKNHSFLCHEDGRFYVSKESQ